MFHAIFQAPSFAQVPVILMAPRQTERQLANTMQRMVSSQASKWRLLTMMIALSIIVDCGCAMPSYLT
ncbi:MAG: hypothetical protein AAGA03_17105, partial [Planctomycetota bacterium]